MKYLSKKRYGLVRNIVLTVIFNILFIFPSFANSVDFTQTTLFKGTVSILSAGIAAFTAITVLVTIFFSVKAGIAWQVADEQTKPQKKKELINTVAIGILVAGLSGLISIILGAYGLTDETGGSNIASINGIYHLACSISIIK